MPKRPVSRARLPCPDPGRAGEKESPAFVSWHRLCDPLYPDLGGAAGEDSASLVRGEHRFGRFALELRPSRDLEPDMVARHKEITERNARILYRGTGIVSYNGPRGAGLR